MLGKGVLKAEYVEIEDLIDAHQSDTEVITVEIVEAKMDPLVPFTERKTGNAGTGGKKDFKCVVCDKTFFSSINLEMHYRFVEHGNAEDVNNSSADDSLVTLVNDKPSRQSTEVSCEVCKKTFPNEKTLIQHCKTSHSMEKRTLRPYQCNLCSKRFTTSSSLKRHLLYHEGIKHFTCTFCGKGFVVNKDLREHEKIHLNEKNYRCEKCAKSFNTLSSLRTHNLSVHTDPSKWKHLCNFCPKRFAMKATLDQHLKRHQGIKEHQCVICGLWFTTKYCLARHMFSHTKEKPYKCTWCPDRIFRDRKRMRVHMRTSHAMVIK